MNFSYVRSHLHFQIEEMNADLIEAHKRLETLENLLVEVRDVLDRYADGEGDDILQPNAAMRAMFEIDRELAR